MSASLLSRFLIITLSLVLSACSGTPDSEKPLALAPIEASFELTELWRTSLGAADSFVFKPAVVGHAVFAAAANGSVVRIEAGREVWKREDLANLSSGVAADSAQVIVGTPKGQVIALATDDGKTLWTAQLAAEIIAPAAFGDGLVIVRSGDNRIYALDRTTGQRKWTYQRSIPPLSVRSTAAPLVADRHIFVGFPGGKVIALTMANGTIAWEGTVALPKGSTELERIADVVAAPVIGAREICAVAHQGRLTCFDVVNGNLLWARDVSSSAGLSLDAKAVYVSDDKGVIQAFDRLSGSSLWKQDKLINRRLTAPLVYQDYVVVADNLGGLHFLDRSDGAFRARFGPDLGGVVAPLVLHEGAVLMQARRGFLIAVQAR